MQRNRFTSVVALSGKLLESLLKNVILDHARHLPYGQRTQLNKLEEKLGAGKKGVESFTLGKLIEMLLSEDIDFINSVSQLTGKERKILQSVNFVYLKELRNRYTHGQVTAPDFGEQSGRALASRAEAQYYLSSLEILSSFFDIELIDFAGIMNELDRLRKETVALQAEKGTIEEVNGLVAYYQRYAEIEANMDYRDTCYYAEHDPFQMSVPELRQLYEKVHYSNSQVRQTRVILNLHNKKFIPWLLLYRFVRDYQRIAQAKTEVRYMFCRTESERSVFLVHTVLLYSAREIDNGYLVLSMFDNQRRQRNMIIRHKRLFDFFKVAYRETFNSCEPLNVEGFKRLYAETYGSLEFDDLERNVRDYYSTVPHDEDDIRQAMDVWRPLLEGTT